MACLRRLSCCRRAFFTFLLQQQPLLLLLLLSFSPLPVPDATRGGLRLLRPPCTEAAAFAAAAAAVKGKRHRRPTLLYSPETPSLLFRPSCLHASPLLLPGVASHDSLTAVCVSGVQCCIGVGFTAPESCFSLLLSSPPASQTSSLGCCLSLAASVKQHHGCRAAVRGSRLPQARGLQVSPDVHSSASPVSFVSAHASPAAAAAASVPSFAGSRTSTAVSVFHPAAGTAAPTPAAFPSTAAASASAAVLVAAGRGGAAPASAACSAAAAASSCVPCLSGWNTYPSWLQGVWQVRFRCFSDDECGEEKIEEAAGGENAAQAGQRRTLPLLTQVGDGTATQRGSVSSMNGEEKTEDFSSSPVLPDASWLALDPRDDLPLLLRTFCSARRGSSSSSRSSDETPLRSEDGLGPSPSTRACCSRTSSCLRRRRSSSSSSGGGLNSDSGNRPPVASKSGDTTISRDADTFGQSAATRGPPSRSSSTLTIHARSAEVLKSADDSRGDTAFYQSGSGSADPAATRDCRDFYSEEARSIPCRASQPRRVAAALHLLTPLQRRSLVLLQETIGLYDVCLEPGGILHFELPAHHGRRSAAGKNAAAAAAAVPERSTRTSAAGNPTEAGSAEGAHLNAQKKALLHSRQPQLLLKKHPQQLEMCQEEEEKQQQQQTHREAHSQVAGKQPLQQALLQKQQQQRQASRGPERGCEELQHCRQLLEEQQQPFKQQESESSELFQEQQQQQEQQPKRHAQHQTRQLNPKAQHSQVGQAFVQQLEQLEEPSTGNQETPSCQASVRRHRGDERQGPATPLLLQHALSQQANSWGAQDKTERREQPIEECVPLTWYFTPASRRLALLFWLPACRLMLRLSCEVRRRGPAGCSYEAGPLCLPAAPLLVYLRDGLDAASSDGLPRGGEPCGAVAAPSAAAPSAAAPSAAAPSAAACLEDPAAAGTQASSVEESAELRGNCAAAASRVCCPGDRWAARPQLCSSPVQEPAASAAPASRSSPAAGEMKSWRRIPSGVWGDGFLYSCLFEAAACCGSMQKMRSLQKDPQWQPKNDQRGHLQRQQHEQQKRNTKQETQRLPRRSQHEQSLRETEALQEAQQGVQQQGHMQRQLLSQQEGLLRQCTQSRDLLHGGEDEMRPKRSLLREQLQISPARTRVKTSHGMALLAKVYVHLKRPRLSRATTKPVSPALRPQQGFLTLRTGLQRHAFLQELRALQQVQLQYLRQFLFSHAAQRHQTVEMQQRHEQEQQNPQQKQLQPRQLQDEQKRRWQPQLHAAQQRLMQVQLLEEQQEQRQQQEEYTRQQREGQQHQAKTELAKQQDQMKVLQEQEWQQPESGNPKKQYSPVHRRQQQLLWWTQGERGLLQELSPDVSRCLVHAVKLLFVERERRWCAAGGLLQRQQRRRTVKEKFAEVSRKSRLGSWAVRKERTSARRISVVSVALNGKVVGWTLPPPPFPVAVGDLLRSRAHVVAARSARGAGLPALLSCEEDAAEQEKAEKEEGVAEADDCAAAYEEEEAVSAAERGRVEATEEAKGAAVAADAILDDHAVLAGVLQGEEAVAGGDRDAGAVETRQRSKATLLGDNGSSMRNAACQMNQIGVAGCRGMTYSTTANRREHCSAIVGEKRTNGAARGSKRASVAAVSATPQGAALGKQKATTIGEARIKQNVQQDVAAALLHPAVQRKLGSHRFRVKNVVYVHRTRLVNFVLQEPLLQNCSEEVR